MRKLITSVAQKTAKASGKTFYVVKDAEGTEYLTYDNVSHIANKMVDFNFEQKGNTKVFSLIGVVDYAGQNKPGGGVNTTKKDAPIPGMVLSYAKDVYIALVEKGYVRPLDGPVESGDRLGMSAILTPLSDIYDFMMLISQHGSRKAVVKAYADEFARLVDEDEFGGGEEIPF